jgi:hypothetical protein
MLAIDVRDCHLTVSTPHRHGGVASMLVALGEARIEVSRIEPRGDDCGMYRLTVSDSPELGVRNLEGIGCQVTRAPTTGSESTSPLALMVTPRLTRVGHLTPLCCLDCKKQTGTLRRCA